jgi:hypothetical protein
MSFENPDWRLEIWHAGEKTAEIRNDEWERVLADFVQFSETRREELELAAAAADEQTEDEDEAEAFAEPASMYWAHFAAAALHRKQMTPEAAATMADELLAEYEKRFPEAA